MKPRNMPSSKLYPLAFGTRISKSFCSPSEWQAYICSAAGWSSKIEAFGDSMAFRKIAARVSMKDLSITAVTHTSIRTHSCRSGLQVLIPVYGAPIESKVNGRKFFVGPGQGFLFAPSGDLIDASHCRSFAMLDIIPERLIETARAMAGSDSIHFTEVDFGTPFETARRSGSFCFNSAMLNLFGYLDGVCDSIIALSNANLSDSIYRLLAMAVWPTALCDMAASSVRKDRTSLDLVTDYIMENLQRDITLTSLEVISGLSRRTVQLLFKEEYGVGPMEWVRSRKYGAARERLLNPEPKDSVKSIALEYRLPLSHFPSTYASLFGELPSDTLLRTKSRARRTAT